MITPFICSDKLSNCRKKTQILPCKTQSPPGSGWTLLSNLSAQVCPRRILLLKKIYSNLQAHSTGLFSKVSWLEHAHHLPYHGASPAPRLGACQRPPHHSQLNATPPSPSSLRTCPQARPYAHISPTKYVC